jgi:tight adherence protein B
MRAALSMWPERIPGTFSDELKGVAARLRLGADPVDAVTAASGVNSEGALRAIVAVHLETGCDAARLLDAAAANLERRAELLHGARAFASGPRLSGKLVAVLPLAFVPLLPASSGWRLDRRGSLLLVAGTGLLLAGMWWIARLLPAAPEADHAGSLAELSAAAIEAGLPLGRALEACSTGSADLDAAMSACVRRVRLGSSWAESLKRATYPGLAALASVVARSEELGTPIASALRAFGAERRVATEAAFEEASRRAPVLMVFPLVLCVLPSFVLLALAPFLRGLSQ